MSQEHPAMEGGRNENKQRRSQHATLRQSNAIVLQGRPMSYNAPITVYIIYIGIFTLLWARFKNSQTRVLSSYTTTIYTIADYDLN